MIWGKREIKRRPIVPRSSVRREKPIPDDQWRKLAEQNPMRVTYPSWRPRAHWEAKAKADPWVLMNGTRDWRKADARKASMIVRTPHAGFQETQPCDPPSGMKLEPRPEEWNAPAWAAQMRRRRRESL